MADAAARAEFQRKQRDRKRLYRARLKVRSRPLRMDTAPRAPQQQVVVRLTLVRFAGRTFTAE